MKNILLVTSLYPLPTKENNCTFVCHYFTKEWVKMGYNVRVIHMQPVHFWGWHLLVKLFGKQLKNRAGGGNYYARKIRKTEEYIMDGVPVYRVPIYNFIPKGRYPQKSVDRFVNEVHSLLARDGFVPDVITAHAIDLSVVPAINDAYRAKTCMVNHGMSRKTKERFPNYRELIDYYDLWGFRNNPHRISFIKNFGDVKKSFFCYSGIPKQAITSTNAHSFDQPIKSFVFIGELIERKYPETLLEAIPDLFSDYHITYIGNGPMDAHLKSVVKEKDIVDNVTFTGKIPRDHIYGCLDKCDCMIMISRGEVFGLVYLEAMARGCLVVASKNEGFDGIIVDGKNGFLCKAGDVDALKQTLKKIKDLTKVERLSISENAIATAKEMTDELVAKKYANELMQL